MEAETETYSQEQPYHNNIDIDNDVNNENMGNEVADEQEGGVRKKKETRIETTATAEPQNPLALLEKLPTVFTQSKPVAKLSNVSKKSNQRLTFTLSHVLPSIANAIRRTILSDIPVVGFQTMPYEENRAKIVKNTSRFNNEYLKQRLACIPIYATNLKDTTNKNEPISNMQLINDYAVKLHVKNKTDSMLWVTTKDFELIHKETGEAVEGAKGKEIIEQLFPPFVSVNDTKHYIDIMSLRPFIADGIPGEEIHLTCEFSICLAKKNSSYNVSQLTTYSNTVDMHLQSKKIQQMKEKGQMEGKSKEEIDFAIKNFEMLEGKRLFISNSFDFVVETLGIYQSETLVQQSCEILATNLTALYDAMVEGNENVVQIKRNTENTIPNCWDIVLHNEDYTLGTMLQDKLYRGFYRDKLKEEEAGAEASPDTKIKMLNFCGFKKEHPHDSHSIIRVGFIEEKHSQVEFILFMFSQIIPNIRAEFLHISKSLENKI